MISDGQRVRALESNAAWASKTNDNTLLGKQTLNHAGSGAIVSDVQQSINDNIDDIANLQTLSGVPDGSTDLGTFPGSTITDGGSVKAALSLLETAVELRELSANKGAANGYAPLDGTSKVPAAYLPSYVDDVLEFANLAAFPVTGETGKVYVALDTGKVYRWTGSVYIEVSPSDVNSVNGQTGVVTLTTSNISEGSNLYYTDARARTAVVDDTIVDGVTNKAPSQNAVFDALALKENVASTANDTTSGSNATLASVTTSNVRLTNGSLVSIDMIPAGSSAQKFILINSTGVVLTVNNETGATAANRILTGTGANLSLAINSNLWLTYDSTSLRWRVVGGSGSGGTTITANSAAVSDGSGAITASTTTATQISYLNTTTSNIQTQLNGKQATVTGAASTVVTSNLNTSRAVVTDGSGKIADSTVTSTEVGYLSGVTSGLQSQLDLKARDLGYINYITNYGAEQSTTGWAAYKDAAQSTPVDGTGGSPTLTFTRTTSTPLRGIASFLITKSAANLQGEGASYDFTIDTSDRAKPLQIGFDYQIVSGTYSGGTSSTDSDLVVYIYDVTNAQVIQPAGYKLNGGVVGTNYNVKATFQTNSNSSSYRLIVHCATTSASAYSVEIDNVSVSPIVTTNGPAMTDWVSFTPVLTGVGTATSVSAVYRRVGDSIEVRSKWVNGTTTAAQFKFGLPTGLAIDTAKLTAAQSIQIGYCFHTITGADVAIPSGNRGPFAVIVNSGVTDGVGVSDAVNLTNGNFTPTLGTGMAATGQGVAIEFSVPIAGWSSNTQVSSDTDTRVISAVAYCSANRAGTTSAPFNFDTVVFDDSGSITTGATWNFRAPLPGKYKVSLTGNLTAGANTSIILYKNGSAFQSIGSCNVNYSPITGSTILTLVAGDTIEVRPTSSVSVTGGSLSTGAVGVIAIERLSGPSQIAASETVSCRYTTTATTALTVGTIVPYSTKSFDTHGAFNTSTSRFTAPAPGIYRITAYAQNQLVTATQILEIGLYKNAVLYSSSYDSIDAAVQRRCHLKHNDLVDLVTGDIIDIRVLTNTLTLIGDAATNFISIERIK